MVSFLCCKAADEDAPSTPKRKKSAVAPRQPSPEEPEETVVETKEEPEEAGPQDGGGISCGGTNDEPCRRRAWAGILPHQRALLCPLHAPAPPLEQIPEEALEILKDGVETDLPLRCAQALQFHLRDITACPYAICDIRRYGDKGEVIGTEWRTLRGRYKWGLRDGEVGEDAAMVTTCFAHATRRRAAKCCGYFAILEGHQANAGPGRDMNDEGFAPPPPFWPKGGVGGHKWRPYDMRPHEDPLDAATRPLVAPPPEPPDENEEEVTVPFNDWHAFRDEARLKALKNEKYTIDGKLIK